MWSRREKVAGGRKERKGKEGVELEDKRRVERSTSAMGSDGCKVRASLGQSEWADRPALRRQVGGTGLDGKSKSATVKLQVVCAGNGQIQSPCYEQSKQHGRMIMRRWPGFRESQNGERGRKRTQQTRKRKAVLYGRRKIKGRACFPEAEGRRMRAVRHGCKGRKVRHFDRQ